jgi:hypothetical protein
VYEHILQPRFLRLHIELHEQASHRNSHNLQSRPLLQRIQPSATSA